MKSFVNEIAHQLAYLTGLFVTKMTAYDAIKEIKREREDSPKGNRLTSYTQN